MGLFKLGSIGQANPTYMWHLEQNTVAINTLIMEKFVLYVAAATTTSATAAAATV